MTWRLVSVFIFFWVNGTCQDIISATCGKCGYAVPVDSRTGDRCPYCHVIWDSESNDNISTNPSGYGHEEMIEKEEVKPPLKKNPKYLIYVTTSQVARYEDKKGTRKSGIISREGHYTVKSIDGEFLNLRDINTGQKVGWAHFSDLKIYEKTSTHPDDPSKDTFGLIDSTDFVESKLTGAVKRDYLKRNLALSLAANQRAKAVGSEIYWNAMARNIMLMILIAAVVLLFKAFNSQQKS